MRDSKPGAFSQIYGVFGIILGLFLLIGLIFAVVGYFLYRSGQDFEAHGVDVMGRVESRWESTRDCTSNNSTQRRTCTDYNVEYSFEVGGTTQRGRGKTDFDTYAGLGEGDPIKVRYLANDPTSSATSFDPERVDASGGRTLMGMIFGGLGGLLAVVGGGGLFWLRRAGLQRAALRDTGIARSAVVQSLDETNMRVNRRMLWRMRWKDDAGATGESRARRREDLPEPGERIMVYVDPTGRLPAVWDGDVSAR
jgi:Protein of unknown function (DUF3592)